MSVSGRWSIVLVMLAACTITTAPTARAGVPPETGWSGEPTWIGGTGRYDTGTWAYQDFVFDDGFRVDNSADIVHVRLRERDGRLGLQFTVNSLSDASSTVLGIAISTASAPTRAWPFAAGVASSWDRFVTVAGEKVWETAADGEPQRLRDAAIDLVQNTIAIEVDANATSTSLLHLNVGAGAWDSAIESWSADGVIDLAFNTQEKETVPAFLNLPEGIGTFRNAHQQRAIDSGDVSYFDHDIDLRLLRSGHVDAPITGAESPDQDEPAPTGAVASTPRWASGLPPSNGCDQGDSGQLCGTTAQLRLINRVYRSIQDLGEGYGPPGGGGTEPYPMAGLYQTYRVTVPPGYEPGTPRPLNLLLHANLGNHNYNASLSTHARLGDDLGAFTVTPLALGPSGNYSNEALVDTLQALADARAHYTIDPDRIGLAGYSMGGGGVWRLTTLLPDVFSAGVIWAGTTAGLDQLENTIHVPLLVIHGSSDELVPVAAVMRHTERLHALGHDYRFNVHPGLDHFSFFFLDDWTRERDWLSERRRPINPAHVVLTVRPGAWIAGPDSERITRDLHAVTTSLGSAIDGAYWVSDVAVDGATGTVNLTSDAIAERVAVRNELLAAVPGPPSPFVQRGISRSWAPAPGRNRLLGSLVGVAEVTIDLERAGLRLNDLKLDVTSDRDVIVHFHEGETARTVTIAGTP